MNPFDKNIELLTSRYPKLIQNKEAISKACSILKKTVEENQTIFVCGNGGSYADSIHIVGELIKGFTKKRSLPKEKKSWLRTKFLEEGNFLATNLQEGIRCQALGTQQAYSTAYINDVKPELVLAQELQVFGNEGDVLLCLSTSGNSKNVYYASLIAKMLKMKVILLTGEKAGSISKQSDCTIHVPETETYKIQELHLPIYHCLCLGLEEYFFHE